MWSCSECHGHGQSQSRLGTVTHCLRESERKKLVTLGIGKASCQHGVQNNQRPAVQTNAARERHVCHSVTHQTVLTLTVSCDNMDDVVRRQIQTCVTMVTGRCRVEFHTVRTATSGSNNISQNVTAPCLSAIGPQTPAGEHCSRWTGGRNI